MCHISELIVMVVEPDEALLKKTCDSLNSLGIKRIVCVENYADAIIALNDDPDIDIVLSDFNIELGQELGMMLCSLIKKEHSHILFILTSENYNCSIVLEGLITADDFFDKSREGEVENLLKKWIDLAQLRNNTRELLNAPGRETTAT